MYVCVEISRHVLLTTIIFISSYQRFTRSIEFDHLSSPLGLTHPRPTKRFMGWRRRLPKTRNVDRISRETGLTPLFHSDHRRPLSHGDRTQLSPRENIPHENQESRRPSNPLNGEHGR